MIQPEESCSGPAAHRSDVTVIPEIEEYADVAKRVVETGTVRITKQVHEVQRTFQPKLHDHQVDIQRIPVNRVIKSAPPVRTEGDTTIIPVVEEVIVKLLLLKEEVHVTTRTIDKPSPPHDVTLRREEVVVQRDSLQNPDKPA